MKSVAMGQYYAAESPIHRLDARTKVILAIVYIVLSFVCANILSFALLLLSGIFVILMSRVPMKIVLRALRPIIIIMVITAFINIFMTTGDDLIFAWRFVKIYKEGLYNAAFMVVRIIIMIVGASIFLTYTTTPINLTDAIERLLLPLKKLHVPVHEFAMMMTIALRFIPTLVDETDKIMSAQKARGVDFESGGLIKKAKALIPILIPLFVSSFRRADELATAMESRCYRGGVGRTKMTVTHMGGADAFSFVLMLAFGTGIVVLNILNIGYTM